MAEDTNQNTASNPVDSGMQSGGNEDINLGPFDRLTDIEGFEVQDFFGGFGGDGMTGGESGGGFSGGGNTSPFAQLRMNLDGLFVDTVNGGAPDVSEEDISSLNPFAAGQGGNPSTDGGGSGSSS